MGDTGQETILAACGLRSHGVVVMSTGFLSCSTGSSYILGQGPQRQCLQQGIPGFWRRDWPEGLRYATTLDFSQSLRNPSPLWPSLNKQALSEKNIPWDASGSSWPQAHLLVPEIADCNCVQGSVYLAACNVVVQFGSKRVEEARV